jgi:hypothetical protein
MKGYLSTLSLALLLGMAGAAGATTAVLDFGDASKSTDAKLVANADGKVTDVKEGTIAAVQTSGTDGTNGYLYIDVKDGLFDKSKAVWARVDYIDKGSDTFQVEYDTDGEANMAAVPVRQKFDTKALTSQVFKLVGFQFKGRETGGADLRINDNADGPEIITRVAISDEDPDQIHFPKNDPAHAIKIDGKKDTGEWDGAWSVTMDRADFDVLNAANWGGKEDFSGTYSFKWDEKGLYILGEVTDATPRINDHEGPGYWAGDGLEQFIGLDQSDPNRQEFNVDTDYQVVISMGDPAACGGNGPSWGLYHGGKADAEDRGVIPASNVVVVKTDKGYMFELLLPWNIHKKDYQAKDGATIGWYMFANNSKDCPSAQQVAMAPFRRPGPSGNPSRWATAELSASLKVENPTAGQ